MFALCKSFLEIDFKIVCLCVKDMKENYNISCLFCAEPTAVTIGNRTRDPIQDHDSGTQTCR